MDNQKKFGVWMDNFNADIVGPSDTHADSIMFLAHVEGEKPTSSASEKNSNNQEKMLQAKFFKEIASHIVNATHVHLTGTGQAQEKFMHYLAETPQFKNTVTTECTSNKMSNERLIEFISEKFKMQ
jgi:stalled ribosome rescue protein Dom34